MAEDVKKAPTPKKAVDAENSDAANETQPASETMFNEIMSDDTEAQEAEGDRSSRGIDSMLGVKMDVQIVLGHAQLPIADLLKLGRGSVVDLDRRIGDPVDVVVNDMLVARGNLIRTEGERIGVTLTEIVRNPAGS